MLCGGEWVCCLPVEVSDGIGLDGRVGLARIMFNILFCNVLYRSAEVEAARAFGGAGSRPGSAYGLYIVRFLDVAIVQMFYLKKSPSEIRRALCKAKQITRGSLYLRLCRHLHGC